MKKRVADIIMDTLVEQGVTECFAVVGGGAMHLDNALGLNAGIHKVFNHHEQACAMAAEGYARMTGGLAAVCVTSGPGATNAITGVMGAWQDSIPMIVLSGQVRTDISVEATGLPLRFRGVQEFDIVPSVRNMTKYAVKLTDPKSVRREIIKAVNIAMSGRRGPVWLDVPMNIQSALVETEELYPPEPPVEEPRAAEADAYYMLDKLVKAKRPVILAGMGISSSGCIEKFHALADRLAVPVIGAHCASDVMYRDHPFFFGQSGLIGPRAGNFIVQNADLILSIGSSLGIQMTGFAVDQFAPKAEIIAVDADEYEMRKPGLRVDRFIHSTAESVIDQLLAVCHETVPVSEEWITYCRELRKTFSPFEPGESLPDGDRVCAYRFWQEFDHIAPDDCVCVLANNTAISSKVQIGTKTEKQRILVNKNCGSMGDDLPQAIGAARAGVEVVCITGDGSVMMNLQELETIRYNKLPIKIVVFSNDGYNAIRQSSKNFFNGFLVGCNAVSGISFPDFSKIAETFGMNYYCCATNGEVADSLKWLFAQEGAAMLEVCQRLDDPVTPKVMSRQLEDGTMLTPALHDMFPFLPESEMRKWMAISAEAKE